MLRQKFLRNGTGKPGLGQGFKGYSLLYKGSGLTTPGPDLIGERDSLSREYHARAGFEPMNFER